MVTGYEVGMYRAIDRIERSLSSIEESLKRIADALDPQPEEK
jgi:hypothetical protein